MLDTANVDCVYFLYMLDTILQTVADAGRAVAVAFRMHKRALEDAAPEFQTYMNHERCHVDALHLKYLSKTLLLVGHRPHRLLWTSPRVHIHGQPLVGVTALVHWDRPETAATLTELHPGMWMAS